MSQYTTQIRWIVESTTPNFQGSLRSRIQSAAPSIFDFDFPIYDESYRLTLETKILAHYYMREIGFETVGLWKLYLETRLCEIMPYYNQLYETQSKKYDYLQDIDLWENVDGNNTKTENNSYGEDIKNNRTDTTDFTSSQTITGDTSGHTETDGTTTATDNSINSDYPQAHLSNTDYATGAVNSDSSGTSTDTTDSTTETSQKSDTENNQTQTIDETRNRNTKNQLTGNYDNHHVKHMAGLNGSRTYTQLIQEYRQSLINIDMMIINELSDLFMMIY